MRPAIIRCRSIWKRFCRPTAEEHKSPDPEGQAFDAAMEIIGNSVMTVGLLPAYGRSADNNVFAMGGMTADWGARTVMRGTTSTPTRCGRRKRRKPGETNPNLPHVDGRYAKFADHIDDFVSGFEDYAKFLLRRTQQRRAGRVVRRLCRPSGAQGHSSHPILLHAAAAPEEPSDHGRRRGLVRAGGFHGQACGVGERFRSALAVAARRTGGADGVERAAFRIAQRRQRDRRCGRHFGADRGVSGLARARERVAEFRRAGDRLADRGDPGEHQFDLAGACAAPAAGERRSFALGAAAMHAPAKGDIRRAKPTRSPRSCRAMPFAAGRARPGSVSTGSAIPKFFSSFASAPISTTAPRALRCFLPRIAAVTGHEAFRRTGAGRDLASAQEPEQPQRGAHGPIARHRRRHRTGLDRLCLDGDGEVPARRRFARRRRNGGELFTDELIAADKQLDVIGGSAGAILGLLRLYRDTRSADVLGRASKVRRASAGAAPDRRERGRRTWVGQGSGCATARLTACRTARPALPMRSRRWRRRRGAKSSRRPRRNVSRLKIRATTPSATTGRICAAARTADWPCQWCHGAPGIGLARIAHDQDGGEAWLRRAS